jgi:hypothetical protein
MNTTTLAAALAAAFLMAGGAHAATVQFKTTLTGANEVPPNASGGKGEVTATLDTKTKWLTYKITYSGLTGPATAAHFHGPAAPGVNAPPVITMSSLKSPIEGEADLTDPQAADLMAGKWYFNVHTAANPSGEIRGQLPKAP